MQGKQLERKANDAALKRAMLGREEAESEMRRYREEARALRRQIEEGKDRERKVGERLESVMVRITRCGRAPLLMIRRRTTAGPKKPMLIHRLYGRRRYGEHARKTSNHSLWSSSFKRN
jgi:hypothetical protein